MSKTEQLLLGVFFFTVGHVLVWFQLNGQFLWESFRKNELLVASGGLFISFFYLWATKNTVESFNGLLWPARFIGFAIGIAVYAIFVGIFFKNSWFNWHKDGRRTCAINVLLTPEDENAYCEMICPDTNEVHRVPYRQNVPMLFNALNIHRVMNTTEKDRKILSISFYDKAHDGSGFFFDEILMLYDKGLMINEMDIYQI